MLRIFAVPAILVVLFVGAYLSLQNMQANGPRSAAGRQEVSQVRSVAAGTDFNQADTVLQAFFDDNQTYAGATLPPGSGVVLARAGVTSYCLQSGTEHENGPGGRPAPGPC